MTCLFTTVGEYVVIFTNAASSTGFTYGQINPSWLLPHTLQKSCRWIVNLNEKNKIKINILEDNEENIFLSYII